MRAVAETRLQLWPVILWAGLAGCGQDENRVRLSEAEQELTYIALAYGEAHQRLGRGPKDADELKPFLKPFGDPENLLMSPNDGQPYVVVWKANPAGGPRSIWECSPFSPTRKKGQGANAQSPTSGVDR